MQCNPPMVHIVDIYLQLKLKQNMFGTIKVFKLEAYSKTPTVLNQIKYKKGMNWSFTKAPTILWHAVIVKTRQSGLINTWIILLGQQI